MAGQPNVADWLSLPLIHGQPDRAGSVSRVPATEVEGVVADVVRGELKTASEIDNCDLIRTYVTRVEVQSDQLVVTLNSPVELQAGKRKAKHKVIQIPWQKPPSKRQREIIEPQSASPNNTRPIRADARANWSLQLREAGAG